MYVRRASIAVVSALVGYGAWYSYSGDNKTQASRAYSTQTSGVNGATPTRSVLVIGQDELRTGTWVGEGPISKTTSDNGRKVVEMLTPEQATQKLRKTEESYFVNRGQGVLRYDVVQLPSNDPIEDDHAEKIVEIPGSAAGNAGSSDWMFWGVFDGHSYAFPVYDLLDWPETTDQIPSQRLDNLGQTTPDADQFRSAGTE